MFNGLSNTHFITFQLFYSVHESNPNLGGGGRNNFWLKFIQ